MTYWSNLDRNEANAFLFMACDWNHSCASHRVAKPWLCPHSCSYSDGITTIWWTQRKPWISTAINFIDTKGLKAIGFQLGPGSLLFSCAEFSSKNKIQLERVFLLVWRHKKQKQKKQKKKKKKVKVKVKVKVSRQRQRVTRPPVAMVQLCLLTSGDEERTSENSNTQRAEISHHHDDHDPPPSDCKILPYTVVYFSGQVNFFFMSKQTWIPTLRKNSE